MKIPRTLAALPLVAAAAFPLLTGSAGAVETTELTVVNGYSYSANNLMAQTVCLDDVLVQSGEAVINPSITTTPGAHVLKVAGNAGEDCADGTVDWTETPVTLHDVGAQTLAFGWQNYDGQEPVNDTWIFDDSQECLPEGQGQIVFRNISTNSSLVANLGSAVTGATDMTGATALLPNVAVGDGATADVDAGTYPANTAERMFGWETDYPDPFVGSNVELPVPEGTIAYVYAHSGNDGPVGLAVTTRDVGVCDAPVTTTTVADSTTTTTMPADGTGSAEAAKPVAAQPTYTG